MPASFQYSKLSSLNGNKLLHTRGNILAAPVRPCTAATKYRSIIKPNHHLSSFRWLKYFVSAQNLCSTSRHLTPKMLQNFYSIRIMNSNIFYCRMLYKIVSVDASVQTMISVNPNDASFPSRHWLRNLLPKTSFYRSTRHVKNSERKLFWPQSLRKLLDNFARIKRWLTSS